MAAHASKKVLFAALAGNSLIAVTKFSAAGITGSSAMFSEAIHSLVDTGNQLLLLFGMRRATRPADELHPFGYGMELYFWTFVVAILIFAIGAGLSLYEGVSKLAHPHPVTDPHINYAVLALALVFEAGAWTVAFREFRKVQGDRSFLHAVQRSKDPTLFTVLFEDSAAMLGLLVAGAGLALGQLFDRPEFDALASIVIGTILASTAGLLAYESKGLLIGESAHPEVVHSLRQLFRSDPRILQLNELLTLHFGPQDVLLNVSVDFEDRLSAGDVETAISELEARIKSEHPEITRVFIEAQKQEGDATAR